MAQLIQELFSPTKKLNTLRTLSLRLLRTQAFSPRLWLREKTNIPRSLCSSPRGWKSIRGLYIVLHKWEVFANIVWCIIIHQILEHRSNSSIPKARKNHWERWGTWASSENAVSPVSTWSWHRHNPKCWKTKGNLATQDFHAKPRHVWKKHTCT